MVLESLLFKDCSMLQACAQSNPAHVTPGSSGEHVARIQKALELLDDAEISEEEREARRYGPSTAAAVLAYKRARKIINPAYQTTADNIVGIMTIRALDRELIEFRSRPQPIGIQKCTRLE